MSDEEWVKAAMTDDSMVVELLIRLNHTTPPKRDYPALPLDWSVRQRRSRTVLHPKKPTARASPTTPLSWSGANSASCGGGGGGGATLDGFEESSQPPPRRSVVARSKVAATSATSEANTTKRSRKKKTLAELKEAEVLLLKERQHLKRELATFYITLEKERDTNERLKKMKLDLLSHSEAESVPVVAYEEAITDQTQQKIALCDPVRPILPPSITADGLDDALPQPCRPNGHSEVQKEDAVQEAKFVLPDLNLPLEEYSSSEILHG